LGILAGFQRFQNCTDLPDHGFLIVTILFAIECIHEHGKIGQSFERQNDIFIQFEGIGSRSDGTESFAVLPEQFGFLRISGNKKAGVGIGFQECVQAVDAGRHLFGGVSHNVDEQHGFGQTGARGLDLIANRADVFLIEMLKGHERFPAVVDEGS